MTETCFTTINIVGPSVLPGEARLLIKRDYERGDVDAAFQNAELMVKRSFRLGREQATIGALDSVADVVSNPVNHRGGASHEFAATPERVLKCLGVLPAGERH